MMDDDQEMMMTTMRMTTIIRAVFYDPPPAPPLLGEGSADKFPGRPEASLDASLAVRSENSSLRCTKRPKAQGKQSMSSLLLDF